MDYEVTACLEAGRLLLLIDRDDEADNADDNKCVLKQFTICDHLGSPPFRGSEGKKLPPVKRANRLPYTSSAER